MRYETDTITLPAHWASFLINGDPSSIADTDERERAQATVKRLAWEGWSIVSTEGEPRFTNKYRLYDGGAPWSAGDVLDYVMLRRKVGSARRGPRTGRLGDGTMPELDDFRF